MRQFTDNTGHRWVLAINCDAVDRVRDQVGVDLDDPFDGEPSTMDKLAKRASTLARTVFAIISPQSESMKVDFGMFEVRVRGAVFEEIREAFHQEWADFFRDFRIEPLEAAVREHRKMIRDGSANLMKQFNSISSASASDVGSSPESLASSPDPGPGANSI